MLLIKLNFFNFLKITKLAMHQLAIHCIKISSIRLSIHYIKTSGDIEITKMKLIFSIGKVKNVVSKTIQPCVSEVSLEWQNFGNKEGIVQAPSHISSIFSGSRQIIFGFVPNCTMVNCKMS